MARPLRVEYPGALYHVMNRGNQRATVFHQAADYRLFLEKLEQTAEQFVVRVYCFCLMPNHFHLYVKTEQANLSRFMQSLLTGFTLSWNRARGSSGHVFQGRFKSHLVEGEGYHAELSRYIHLNPVRVADGRERAVAERRAKLRRYRWSSYPAYLGLRKAPEWLVRDAVLSRWKPPLKQQIQRHRRFVEEGLLRDVKSPYAQAAAQSLVGGESFVERIKREYLSKRAPDRREEPSLLMLQESVPLDQVVSAVAQAYSVERERLLLRAGSQGEARRLAMYLASVHCRGGSSLTALAEAFGVSLSGLTRARGRVEEQLRRDRRLRAVAEEIGQKVKSNA